MVFVDEDSIIWTVDVISMREENDEHNERDGQFILTKILMKGRDESGMGSVSYHIVYYHTVPPIVSICQ